MSASVPLQAPSGARPEVPVRAARVRRTPTRAALIAAGLLAGATWGAAARAWMRTVSDSPSFTWVGTLMILVLAALAGVGLALVEALRQSGIGVARFLPVVLALPLFAGQGLVLLPGGLLLGYALSGRGPRWVAVVAACVAQVPTALMAADLPFLLAPYPLVVQVGGFVGLVLVLGAGWRTVFLPGLRRPPEETGSAGSR